MTSTDGEQAALDVAAGTGLFVLAELVRLSVGIEEGRDLVADLERAGLAGGYGR